MKKAMGFSTIDRAAEAEVNARAVEGASETLDAEWFVLNERLKKHQISPGAASGPIPPLQLSRVHNSALFASKTSFNRWITSKNGRSLLQPTSHKTLHRELIA